MDELEKAFAVAEAGMEEASGGVEELQASINQLVPKFLSLVQGSMRQFVGKVDHSERESREHTDMVLKTMGMLMGGLRWMSYLRREM